MASGEDRALWFLNGLKPGEVFLRFLLDTQEPALRRKGALLRLLQLRLKSLNTLFGLLQLLRYPLCRADSTIGGLAWVVCLSIMMMPLPIFSAALLALGALFEAASGTIFSAVAIALAPLGGMPRHPFSVQKDGPRRN